MNARANPEAITGEFGFSDQDFTAISQLVHREYGLNLSSTKKNLVYSRLAKRLRVLEIQDFTTYRKFVASSDGAAERVELLSSLTTNVSHFFREAHHFKSLRETVLPPLIHSAQRGKRVRIWSAGCSAGQEPYSIALTLLDLCPDVDKLDIKILATDVDPAVLRTAQSGLYSTEDLAPVPPKERNLHFNPSPEHPEKSETSPKLKSLITFGVLNLVEKWPLQGPFDIIFCRNVAIYFDKPTQNKIWREFADFISDDGYLFIGHSERISGPVDELFDSLGMTSYRKRRQKRMVYPANKTHNSYSQE